MFTSNLEFNNIRVRELIGNDNYTSLLYIGNKKFNNTLQEILTDELFLNGYTYVYLDENDDIKLKLLIKLYKLNYINIFLDIEEDLLIVCITRKLIERLDRGLNGLRIIILEGLDDKLIKRNLSIFSNRIEEYLPCRVNKKDHLVINKNPFLN